MVTLAKTRSAASMQGVRALAQALSIAALAGCTASQPPRARTPEAPANSGSSAIQVPATPRVTTAARRIVAQGLRNPRGMVPLAGGGLLVSEAGTGDPEDANSGALVRLMDRNADGDFDDPEERQTLLGEQPSKNILHIVRRDEVFGMAAIAEGDGTVLAALAFFGGPSTIFRVEGDNVAKWGFTHGNVNDLTYDPGRKHWYGVASTTDEIIRLLEGGRAERLIKFPTLPSGQDAVPGYLEHDPETNRLLVSLFSGSPEGEEGGDGTELVPGAGAIVAVDPDSRTVEQVISGLTVPTDFVISPDGNIYILEFCDAFLDPVNRREDMWPGPMHGGFKRFSGRLLRVNRRSREVDVIATGLDEPTNMVLSGNTLYIAEGMGTPGRAIPTPEGPRPLTGFISAVTIE